MNKIRQPAVAGRFYSANPTALSAEVRSFLGLEPKTASRPGDGKAEHGGLTQDAALEAALRTKPSSLNEKAEAGPEQGATGEKAPAGPDGGRIMGLLLPHAGYIFSGAVAGLTLRRLLDEPEPLPDLFVLLGPSHSGRGAPLAVWPDGVWRTPLGDLPVDASFTAELIGQAPPAASPAANPAGAQASAAPSPFKSDLAAHLHDHAIEVILPFLREIAPQASIAPICVADYNLEHLRLAGKLLAETIVRRDSRFGRGGDKSRICLITSSDMNHFLPHEQNMRLDALALDRLRALDPEGLFRVVREKGISMCGFAPACLMLFACLELGAENCRITAHTSSGITGRSFGADMGRVVGYAGAVIT